MTKLQNIQNTLKQKKTHWLLIGAVVLIIGTLIVNTVIDLMQPINVISYSPQSTQVGTTIKGTFASIEFSKPISEDKKKELKFTVTPETEYDVLWKTPQTAVLTNEFKTQALLDNVEYTIKVHEGTRELVSWPFKTAAYEDLSSQQQFEKFAQGQSALHNEAEEILAKRPWVDKLPIKEKAYVVFWDETNQSIIIQLYTRTGNYNTEEKITAVQNEITGKLQQLGVDTNNEKIQVQKLVI